MTAAAADDPASPIDAGEIMRRCRELGFAVAGVAHLQPSPRDAARRAWIAGGRHGSMSYLDQHESLWRDARNVLPGAVSAIVVADRYAAGRTRTAPVPGRGHIAAYARGRDYHKVMKRRLHALCDALQQGAPGALFRACVDTAPVAERELAALAGLGAIGKHTLLIERNGGSWLLLGVVLTSLTLEAREAQVPTEASDQPGTGDDPCGTCTRCIDACPTDAITPFEVDATRCVSYLTIEHRGAIDPALFPGLGDWIFGCDDCQTVCPHNAPTRRHRSANTHEAYDPTTASLDLLDVLGWTEDDRRAAFQGSPMKRARLDMIRRNAVIVAGNALATSNDAELRSRIEQIAGNDEEPDIVRSAARSVVAR